MQTNYWSLAFWQQRDPGKPPLNHRHAAVWLAMDAINQGKLVQAVAQISTLKDLEKPYVDRALGWTQMLSGDFAEAVDIWQSIGDYRTLINAAVYLEASGELGAAHEALKAAQSVNPTQGTKPLADFLRRQDAPDAAADALIAAIDAYPHSESYRADWLQQLGDILLENGQLAEAEATYQAYAAFRPVEGALRLGWLAHRSGQGTERAFAQFETAEEADPIGGKGLHAKATLLAREKQLDEADHFYGEAIQRRPSEKSWWISYANNARNQGHLDEAIRLYGETVRRFPDYATAYYELAKAYQQAGYETAAVDAIERAMALETEPKVHYLVRAAQIYEAGQQSATAIEYYKQVLVQDADHRVARTALERLQASN